MSHAMASDLLVAREERKKPLVITQLAEISNVSDKAAAVLPSCVF